MNFFFLPFALTTSKTDNRKLVTKTEYAKSKTFHTSQTTAKLMFFCNKGNKFCCHTKTITTKTNNNNDKDISGSCRTNNKDMNPVNMHAVCAQIRLAMKNHWRHLTECRVKICFGEGGGRTHKMTIKILKDSL